jgi:hypothetical protein
MYQKRWTPAHFGYERRNSVSPRSTPCECHAGLAAPLPHRLRVSPSHCKCYINRPRARWFNWLRLARLPSTPRPFACVHTGYVQPVAPSLTDPRLFASGTRAHDALLARASIVCACHCVLLCAHFALLASALPPRAGPSPARGCSRRAAEPISWHAARCCNQRDRRSTCWEVRV